MGQTTSFDNFSDTRNLSVFYYVLDNQLNALVVDNMEHWKANINNFLHTYRQTMQAEFTGVYIGCLKFNHSKDIMLWDNPILDLSKPTNIYYLCPQRFVIDS